MGRVTPSPTCTSAAAGLPGWASLWGGCLFCCAGEQGRLTPVLSHCFPLPSWEPGPLQQPYPLGEQAGLCVCQVRLPAALAPPLGGAELKVRQPWGSGGPGSQPPLHTAEESPEPSSVRKCPQERRQPWQPLARPPRPSSSAWSRPLSLGVASGGGGTLLGRHMGQRFSQSSCHVSPTQAPTISAPTPLTSGRGR